MGETSLVIDLSTIPTKPLNKKEIRQLEVALIIGSLLSPDIADLVADPIERTNWIDSIAVAAGVKARQSAGMGLTEIVNDLGRSEITIRSHLEQKTKAGKIVAKVYDSLLKGELVLTIPGVGVSREDISRLQEEIMRLKDENSRLKETINSVEQERSSLKDKINKLEEEIKHLYKVIDELNISKEQLLNKINELRENLQELRDQLSNLVETVDSIIKKTVF